MAEFSVVKTYDPTYRFDGWQGGKDTLDDLLKANDGNREEVFDKLYHYLDENGLLDEEDNIDETEFNDTLWFDRDEIYKYFGLDENGEPKSDDDEDDETEDSVVRRPRRRHDSVRRPVRHYRGGEIKDSPWLDPEYDRRQSFYKKAWVQNGKDGTSTLYSYETKVAQIKKGEVTLFSDWNYSPTTLRHVKEFLKQNGFKADTQAQMARDYKVVDE